MAHYEDVHSSLAHMSSPDAEDMAADTDTDDNEERSIRGGYGSTTGKP